MFSDLTVDHGLWAMLIVAVYKIASLIVGLLFSYMGYRLFLAGIDREAGNLEAKSGGNYLKLSGTAPGIFFALFGAVVVAVTITQGFEVDVSTPAESLVDILPSRPPMETSPGNAEVAP